MIRSKRQHSRPCNVGAVPPVNVAILTEKFATFFRDRGAEPIDLASYLHLESCNQAHLPSLLQNKDLISCLFSNQPCLRYKKTDLREALIAAMQKTAVKNPSSYGMKIYGALLASKIMTILCHARALRQKSYRYSELKAKLTDSECANLDSFVRSIYTGEEPEIAIQPRRKLAKNISACSSLSIPSLPSPIVADKEPPIASAGPTCDASEGGEEEACASESACEDEISTTSFGALLGLVPAQKGLDKKSSSSSGAGYVGLAEEAALVPLPAGRGRFVLYWKHIKIICFMSIDMTVVFP